VVVKGHRRYCKPEKTEYALSMRLKPTSAGYHCLPEQQKKDRFRELTIRKYLAGITFLRFTNYEVLKNTPLVIERIVSVALSLPLAKGFARAQGRTVAASSAPKPKASGITRSLGRAAVRESWSAVRDAGQMNITSVPRGDAGGPPR
jgi:hypothetical protein